MENISHKYDDIINLPHHVSKKHPQMSLHDRAAQFSPFAALTGHKAAINETTKLTTTKTKPPIVGVPALLACCFTSSRVGCPPNFFLWKNIMTLPNSMNS